LHTKLVCIGYIAFFRALVGLWIVAEQVLFVSSFLFVVFQERVPSHQNTPKVAGYYFSANPSHDY
jgi:hypothetical protein